MKQVSERKPRSFMGCLASIRRRVFVVAHDDHSRAWPTEAPAHESPKTLVVKPAALGSPVINPVAPNPQLSRNRGRTSRVGAGLYAGKDRFSHFLPAPGDNRWLNLLHLCEKCRQRYVKRLGQSSNVCKRKIARSTFGVSNVRPVHVRTFRERLLGQTELLSVLADRRTEQKLQCAFIFGEGCLSRHAGDRLQFSRRKRVHNSSSGKAESNRLPACVIQQWCLSRIRPDAVWHCLIMATKRISADSRVVTITMSGPTTRQDILEAIFEYYPELGTRWVLWDLMAADMATFTSLDFYEVAGTARLIAPATNHRKVAYATADPQAFLKVCRYANEAMLTGTGAEYRAFRDADQARAWLLAP